MRLLLHWVLNALALMLLPWILPSIRVNSIGSALLAVLVIGLLNALVRPVLFLLTLPITLLTLGLFTLVINALLFWAAADLVGGFSVDGFWTAFWGALVYSVICWALSGLVGIGQPRR
jgi:putative membrane protein